MEALIPQAMWHSTQIPFPKHKLRKSYTVNFSKILVIHTVYHLPYHILREEEI